MKSSLLQTLGNHEFDDYINGLVPFLNTIKTPVVLANVDASNEPAIQGKFQNSTIIQRGNQQIGVIGILTQDTLVTFTFDCECR